MFEAQGVVTTDRDILSSGQPEPLGDLLLYSQDASVNFNPNDSIALSDNSYLDVNTDPNLQTNSALDPQLNNTSTLQQTSSVDLLTGKPTTEPIVGAAIATSEPIETFATRSQKLLAQFANTNFDTYDSRYTFWYAQALFATGATDKARAAIDLAHQTPSNDDSFYYWGLIDSYLRWNNLYTEAQKATAKQLLVDATTYNSGKTQNQKLMLATARYLASEEFPDLVFASDYSLKDPTGKNKILTMMSQFVSQGMVEHDSPTYHAMYLGAFRTLAEFAKDAEVKQKAAIVFEWLLINPSGEWLDGHWAASSLRKFPYVHRQNQYGAGQYALWLFFGGAEPAKFLIDAAYAVQHAVSDYRVPEIIEDIATDRQHSYLHRAYDRWGGKTNDQFYKTTYMNGNGAIYSQFEELGDPLGWSDQGHRWGIVWTDSTQDSILWVTHPKKGPSADKKTRGITDYEQVLQHNKTIVGVYNIPANDPYKYVIGKTPQGFIDYIDRSEQGEIYLDYGNIAIALSLFTIAPDGKKIGFDWTALDTEFVGPRSIPQGELKVGLVATVAFQGEYTNLTEFANAVNFEQNINYTQILDADPRLQYTDREGNLLDIQFDRHLKVNNLDLNPQSWPLMENPWTTQPQNGNLQLKYGSREREYLFGDGQWQVKTNGIIEQNGELKIEAENFVARDQRLDSPGSEWMLKTAQTGYQGTGYVESLSDTLSINHNFDAGAEISYDITINNPGNYNLWVKRYATDKHDNSLYVAIDGQQVGGIDNIRVFNQWTWQKIGAIDLDRGPHSLQLRRREAGYKLDSILLTTSPLAPVI
ncbi:MAG: hypothetical protein QNJ38_21890 [Prochloraceae cyanobacterium]|nr:hypothetical protein [Prochloraceae cyanobacterium]